jgi:hypothetical protein
VRNLLGRFGDARLEYREILDLERRAQSSAELGFDGVLAIEPPERPRSSDLPGTGPMRIVFVASSPGVGATAIAAALSQMLAQEGDACGAVDLHPAGELLRRLGAPAPPACAERCGGLHLSAEGGGGVRSVAAGCQQGGGFSTLTAAWERISQVLLDCSTIVVDASPEVAPAVTTADADAVVAVLRPSAGLRDAVAGALSWRGRAPLHFLLNAFDGRRAADRAARAALEALLGRALLPVVIHEDAALAELTPGASLAETSPESQVLRDLADLTSCLTEATWMRRSAEP